MQFVPMPMHAPEAHVWPSNFIRRPQYGFGMLLICYHFRVSDSGVVLADSLSIGIAHD